MYNAQMNRQYVPDRTPNYGAIARDVHGLYTDAVCRLHQIDVQLGIIEQRLANTPQDDFACRINGNHCKWFRVTPEAKENSPESMAVTAGKGRNATKGPMRSDGVMTKAGNAAAATGNVSMKTGNATARTGASSAKAGDAQTKTGDPAAGADVAPLAVKENPPANPAVAKNGLPTTPASAAKNGFPADPASAAINDFSIDSAAAKGNPPADPAAANNDCPINPTAAANGHRRRQRHHFEYIPKSKEALARDLALNKYLTFLAADLCNEREALELLIHRLDRDCRHAEKYLASTGIESLISGQLDDVQERVRNWQSEPYDRSTDRLDGLNVPTIGGFNVRSKSEALIANILLEREIPFRYEYVQLIDQRRYVPDFTILHPDTEKIVIWEHFGMMSDITYRSDYQAKIGRYIAIGFIPYENLITTYESNEVPFSAETANRIVKMMFHR